MEHENAPLDALRARRAQLRRSLADAIAARSIESAEIADTVAATGAPSAEWPARSAKLDSDIHSLELGLKRLEADVHAELGAVNLRVAKLQRSRQVLVSTRDQLCAERTALFADAWKRAADPVPIPSTFAPALAALESRLTDTAAQLAATDLEIATASAPALRYEREHLAASQRADITRAHAA